MFEEHQQMMAKHGIGWLLGNATAKDKDGKIVNVIDKVMSNGGWRALITKDKADIAVKNHSLPKIMAYGSLFTDARTDISETVAIYFALQN